MNLNSIKSKLDKVNRFYDYLAANQAIISKVDEAAFLAAIRKLYEACFDENTAVAVPAAVVEETKPMPKKKKTKVVFTGSAVEHKVGKVATIEEKTVESVISSASAPDLPKPPKPEPKEETQTIEVPPAIAEKSEPKEEIKEEPKEEIKEVETVVLPPIPTVEKVVKKEFKEEYEELFEYKAPTDLSQKLSAMPVADLSKALGLNQKFLYINQLFGGDVAAFQTTMKLLNEMNSFEEARFYIEDELISNFDWLKNKERKQVTKDFIKLVRRRYL